MQHNLKIKQCYLMHILDGTKTFEVRENDRDFQVGDTINFLPIIDDDYDVYENFNAIPKYLIKYILSDFHGLQKNFICMAITPLESKYGLPNPVSA